jgi:hypothetical protein
MRRRDAAVGAMMGPVERRQSTGRLTSEDVALVMQRAAELDGQAELPDVDGIDAAAVEAAAREVGLPTSAVRQALAELHAGTLEPTGRGTGERGNARRAVEARVVATPAETVHTTMEQFLRRQTFDLRRRHGPQAIYRSRFDVAAKVRRGIDLKGSIQLNGVRTVTLTVSPSGDRRHLVRLEAELVSLPGRAKAAALGAGSLVFATVAIVGVNLFDGWLAITGAALAAGILAGRWLGRRLLRRRNEEVCEVLAGFLDSVEGYIPP